MRFFGCHLSAAKGYAAMVNVAAGIGADTFQFFTRNPRGGNARALDEEDIRAFLALCAQNGIGPVVAHAPYTLNPCSASSAVRDFAMRAMLEDLERLEKLPGALYNFHPGSHGGQGAETGIRQIAQLLDIALDAHPQARILLETMAGKGSEIGGRFEELRDILAACRHGERIGVCLDTCHVFDAGYDIVNDLDGVLTAFDRVVGLDRLRAVHLNDSKNPLGSRKDRHEKLGQGQIGLEALLRVAGHPAFASLPIVLETPNELPGYAEEIALLRKRVTA